MQATLYINDLWPRAFADETQRCFVAVELTPASYAAVEELDVSLARHFTWGNVPLEGVTYRQTDRAGALWAMRSSRYSCGARMSRAFQDAYEWEAAERSRAAA